MMWCIIYLILIKFYPYFFVFYKRCKFNYSIAKVDNLIIISSLLFKYFIKHSINGKQWVN